MTKLETLLGREVASKRGLVSAGLLWISLAVVGYFTIMAGASMSSLNDALGGELDGAPAFTSAAPRLDGAGDFPVIERATQDIDRIQDPCECDARSGVVSACIFL